MMLTMISLTSLLAINFHPKEHDFRNLATVLKLITVTCFVILSHIFCGNQISEVILIEDCNDYVRVSDACCNHRQGSGHFYSKTT